MLLYLFRETEACTMRVFGLRPPPLAAGLCGRHSQVGSWAGAAHLLNDNAGVPEISCKRNPSHEPPTCCFGHSEPLFVPKNYYWKM